MMQAKPKAVVLLSGGLDSTTVLAMANASGYETYALSFSYGQRHSWELECARKIAANSGVKDHRIAQIDLRVFGGSALTADISVPKGRSLEEMSDKIPVTYVPARNTIFLSFALAWAEVLGSSDIFIGVNALDYSGYRRCRFPRCASCDLVKLDAPCWSESYPTTRSNVYVQRRSKRTDALKRSVFPDCAPKNPLGRCLRRQYFRLKELGRNLGRAPMHIGRPRLTLAATAQ
jgi:queuosine biosynthesis protein QueC